MSIISLFKSIGSKYDLYSGKDCERTFCKSLREHAAKMINFKKENQVINKRPQKIVLKCKNLLYL